MNLRAIGTISFYLPAILVVSTLIPSPLFIYASLTPYFFFCLTAGVCIFFAGTLLLLKQGGTINRTSMLCLAIIGGWAIYIFLNSYWLQTTGGIRQGYLLICLALLASALLVFHSPSFRPQPVFRAISIIAALEALVCIAQSIAWIPSLNAYFRVTGTWVNPNVTAMFLAMAFPAMVLTVMGSTGKWKVTGLSILAVTGIALLLLQCRTAMAAVIIAAVYIAQYRYNLVHAFNKRFRMPVRVLILSVLTLMVVLLCVAAWQAKKDSANGRLLVWKISLNMIPRYPVTGYGYGMFERNYNLAQADYFRSGKGTHEEKAHASHVMMAYNEYFENLVEGGIAGVLFFVSLLALLSYTTWRIFRAANAFPALIAGTGVLVFAIMSFVNFTMAAIPVMCLFMLYAAMLLSSAHPPTIRLSPLVKRSAGWLFIGCGVITWYVQGTNALAHHAVKRSVILVGKGRLQQATALLQQQAPVIGSTESFGKTLGQLYLQQNDHAYALAAFQQAARVSSSPDLYLLTGQTRQALHQYQDAITAYQTAAYIHPSRLAPRYALMNLYLQQQDTARALQTAREIIALEPRVHGKETKQIKDQAGMVMQRFVH
ncbi:MAG TPA: O-antigen ligase family protein [Niastella sp.]